MKETTVRYYCDLCKHEKSTREIKPYGVIVEFENYNGCGLDGHPRLDYCTAEYDLCRDCASKICAVYADSGGNNIRLKSEVTP